MKLTLNTIEITEIVKANMLARFGPVGLEVVTVMVKAGSESNFNDNRIICEVHLEEKKAEVDPQLSQ